VVSEKVAEKMIVLIGTLGQSQILDALIAAKKLDVTGIAGAWEAHVTQVVDAPLPGVSRALVIAGSDRRGTIYGCYELSKLIGVSPWNWWADVPVVARKNIALRGEGLRQNSPAVKYRGIFLNDEDWGLRPWASKTFEPDAKNIGPKTYAKIFELLLRLRGNFIWPAMHHGTKAFNQFAENKEVADHYGIVMGASHCEQMLRNNVSEWSTNTYGEYNYVVNRDGVLHYWEERVRENAKFENVFTMGMRGIHDGAMPGGGSREEQAARLHQIIADQRELLARHVNTNVALVPQIFCPYKEVLALYRQDPNIPEDITLVWPDDNYGYIRQFSSDAERQRSGGAGVYYHVSYWGAPCDYLWLESTPPALIREEMAKAYDYGASNLWVLNVGDLKPAEFATDFFLKLAWQPHRWNAQNVNDSLQEFAAQNFGGENSAEIAAVLTEYYRLNFQRKPEHLGFHPRLGPYQKMIFSPVMNGDEADAHLTEWRALLARETALAQKISAAQAAAYFQLVGYPVTAAGAANAKAMLIFKAQLHAARGRDSTAAVHAEAVAAHDSIAALTEKYNALAGGKWHGMMFTSPNKQGSSAMPGVEIPNPSIGQQLSFTADGNRTVPSGDTNYLDPRVLPQFNAYLRRPTFVDVFNQGRQFGLWTITSTNAWLKFSTRAGTNDARVTVDVDWAHAPQAPSVTGAFTVEYSGVTNLALYDLHNPGDTNVLAADFIEDNFHIVMNATSAREKIPGKFANWETANGLGYHGQALALNPVTAPVPTPATPEKVAATQPALRYQMWLRSPGEWTFTVRCLPTFSVQANQHPRFALALDDAPPQIVELLGDGDERSPTWGQNVIRNAALSTATINVAAPGLHTLTLWAVDSGMVFDAILGATRDAQDPGYLWPTETRIVK
jgi:hypothetical protein